MKERVGAIQDLIYIERIEGNFIYGGKPPKFIGGIIPRGVDFSQMNEGELQSFIARLGEIIKMWDFPFQWCLYPSLQDLSVYRGFFMRRAVSEGKEELARRLLDFMDEVLKNLKPCVYLPLIIVWDEEKEKLMEKLEKVSRTLLSAGIGSRFASPQEIISAYRSVLVLSPSSFFLHPAEKIARIMVKG